MKTKEGLPDELTVASRLGWEEVVTPDHIFHDEDVEDDIEEDSEDDEQLETEKLPCNAKLCQGIRECILQYHETIHRPQTGRQVDYCDKDVGVLGWNLRVNVISVVRINIFELTK